MKTFKVAGHTVEMTDYISSRVSRGYQRFMTSTSVLKVDGKKPKVVTGELSLDLLADAQEYALEKMVISVTDAEGVVQTFDDLLDLPEKEVKPLFDYVEKLLSEGTLSAKEKKDGSATASGTKKK